MNRKNKIDKDTYIYFLDSVATVRLFTKYEVLCQCCTTGVLSDNEQLLDRGMRE